MIRPTIAAAKGRVHLANDVRLQREAGIEPAGHGPHLAIQEFAANLGGAVNGQVFFFRDFSERI